MRSVMVDVVAPLAMVALNGGVAVALVRNGKPFPHRPAVFVLTLAPVIYGLGVLLALTNGTPQKPWTPGLAIGALGTFAIPLALAATAVPRRGVLALLLALAVASWLLVWVPAARPTDAWTLRESELVLMGYVALAGATSFAAVVVRKLEGRERRAQQIAAPLLAVGVLYLLLKAPDARTPVISTTLLVAAEAALLVHTADRLGGDPPATQRTRAVQALLLALGALLLLVVAMNLRLFPKELGPALVAMGVATGMSIAYAALQPRLDAWLTGALYPRAAEAERQAKLLAAELDATRERLRDAEHLALVGQLAAQVAHEIKNPLGPIKGYARIIERELERTGALSDVVARGIGVIREEVEAIDGRARGLLELARPPLPSLAPLDLARVVGDVVALVEGDRPPGVTLTFAPPAAPATVESDRLLLRSALTNVIQNALGACGERGSVTIGLVLEGDAYTVTVDDDGPGLPADLEPEKLFRPFGSRREGVGKAGGHGLGLVIARGAARALGGELTLGARPAHAGESRGGARATLRVPVRPASPAPALPAEPIAAPQAPLPLPEPAQPERVGGAA